MKEYKKDYFSICFIKILEEECLYGGKGRLDCCSHISSRQTVWDLHQGDGDHVDDDDDDQDDGDDDDEQSAC